MALEPFMMKVADSGPSIVQLHELGRVLIVGII